MSEHLPPEALERWVAALCDRFDLDPADIPIGGILDLAKDAAHGVARPAAPLTAFVAGLVAGRAGAHAPEATRETFAAMSDLAAGWDERG